MNPDIPGESHDHPHHRGLWFTHGDVNGYDFWGNETRQKGAGKGKGEVVLKKVNKVSSGKTGTIDATFEWKADGHTLLTESRKMTFYSDPHIRTIDFDITLSPDEKVTFGDTKEGMFAIRLAAPLGGAAAQGHAEPKRTGKLVNAAEQSRARRTSLGQAFGMGRYLRPDRRPAGGDHDLRSPRAIRGIPPTGIRAITACSRPTFSASTISKTTNRATAA